jgi:hypothetical protein
MRWWRRYRSVLTVAFLLAAGFGLVRAATSDPSLRYAVDQIAERLEERLGLQLIVGEVIAQPGSARVEVRPVLLKDSDGVVLFSAQRMSLEVAPLQMFARRVQLDSLEIDSPRFNVRVTKDGRVKGIKPLKLDEDASDDPLFRVDVKDFRVRDGGAVVTVEDVVTTSVHGITIRLRSRGPDGHRLKFRVARTEITRPDDEIVLDEFGGRLVVFGDGLLAPDRVSVSDITIATEEATLQVAGSLGIGALDRLPSIDIDVNATAPLPPVLAHAKLPVEIEGAVSVGAHISARQGGEDLQVVGQADVTDLKVNQFGIGTLHGRFVADPKKVVIPAATFQVGGTTVEGDATVWFDEALAFQVQARGEDFSIYELVGDLKLRNAWADVLIDAEVSGNGRILPEFDFAGEGRGHFHNLRVASRDVRTVPDDDLILHAPQPIFANMDLAATKESMRFEGTIEDDYTRAHGFTELFFDKDKGMVLEAESDRAAFTSVLGKIAGLDFGGEGGGRVRMAGPYNRVDIRAEAWINGFELEDYAFGDLDGGIHSLEGVLAFEDVTARKGTSKYFGDVVLDFRRDATIRVPVVDTDEAKAPGGGDKKVFTYGDRRWTEEQVNGLHIDVDVEILAARAEELRRIIPERYSEGVLGFVRELEMEGPIAGPVKAGGYIAGGTTDHLTGGGDLFVGDGATLLGQTLRGGTGRFSLDLDDFHVDNLTLAVAGGTAHLDSVIDRHEGGITGQLRLDGLELRQIDTMQGTAREFAGEVSLEGRLSHLANDPTLDGRARLRDAAWGEIPIGDADLTVHHEGRVASLAGAMLSGRGSGEVTVGTRSPFEYTASIALSDGPAAPLLPPDLLPEALDVNAGGTVDAYGQMKAFSDSRGTITLRSVELSYRDMALFATGDTLAHFRGARLTVDQLELASARGDAVSTRGLISSERVDITLSARGDLWFVPSFIERVNASRGRFQLDLAVTGDLDRASMHGQGRISGARFEVARFDPIVQDVNARLLFRGPNVLVDSLRGRLDEAPMRGQGTITLSGLSPSNYDLQMDVENLKLRIPQWLRSRSSGRLALTGPAALPTLSGEMTVHQAAYTEDINWENALPDLRRKTETVRVYDKEEEDVRFDVHLIADNGIVVENNVLDLEAKGDLFLVGTEERPGLKGTVSLLRGNAFFQNNRYRLTHGTVDFVDTFRITPVLDVAAETTVKEWDVTARVGGRLDGLDIQLGSRPELAEIDILALLTFGFTQDQLEGAGGAVTGAGAGLEMVSAYTGLNEEVNRIVPDSMRDGIVAVEDVRLSSMFSERQTASIPAVTVSLEMRPGWALVDGSRLKLQSSLVDEGGNGTEQRVEWEKRFDNDMRLRLTWNSQDTGSGEAGDAYQFGDLGLDAWYRWEF